MSVAEIGALHGRYVRLTDRFKSLWTYHQFAGGVFRTLIEEPLPYKIDFQKLFDGIKSISGTLTAAQAGEATSALTAADHDLARASVSLLQADERISPSMLRRFFEGLKRQDENIIHHLIKFYLYCEAVEGDRRDKLDFLFTRIGEEFSLEFREKLIAMVGLLNLSEPPQEEVVRLIRSIRSMRDEIQQAERFEELTDRGLLRNARTFKHHIGALYFNPDILLAVVEFNIATKNKFLKLYQNEEQRILEDSQKLMEHGGAIERNFGDTNPELVEEISRFREFKERFDEAREQSNVKHDTITRLKASITNILAQLDRGLGGADQVPELLDEPIDEESDTSRLIDHFGGDEVLVPQLQRIAAAIDACDVLLTPEQMVETKRIRELRLEAWEVAAYEKILGRREAEASEDNEDLWILYLRAAALRVKVDEEATMLAMSATAGVRPEAELLTRAKESLDQAKTLDASLGTIVHEEVYSSNPKILRQLYRSRFRLLRCFSGLWLVYDKQS